VEAFIIPKEDIANVAANWHDVFNRIAEDIDGYLSEYFQRELAESYHAADKERFGDSIAQIRENRRESTTFGRTVLHNVFSVRVVPG